MIVKELIEYLQTIPQSATIAIWNDHYKEYLGNLDIEDAVHYNKTFNEVRFIA